MTEDAGNGPVIPSNTDVSNLSVVLTAGFSNVI